MFIDRRKRDRGTNLKWRVRLLGLGALLGLVGIGTEREWLVNVALGVLIVGFGLRFLARDEAAAEEEEASPDEEEAPPGEEEPPDGSRGDVDASTEGGPSGKEGEGGPGNT
ncbi:MAG: hypothetical protein JSU98_00205 [Gemmatimonadales bacterium]|nr:MAG: hypothetical protein JSU98_00205 [Gemmatimonadales bacterium]